MQNHTKIALGSVAVVAGIIAVVKLAPSGSSGSRDARPPTTSAASATTPRASSSEAERPSPTAASASAAPPTAGDDAAAGPAALFSARWGSGRGALGHARPNEGNAEGPMSFALAGDTIVVVDQVNGRLVRYDREGRVLGTTDVPVTTQDVAVAADGTAISMDRLGEKTLTLTDPSGRRVGELPLTGPKVGNPGLLTGVFVDGKDVYVEKEHGALVKVGTTDGRASDDGEPLTGRPSKDGVLVLTAGFTAQPSGQAWLNAFDRKKGALRFARTVVFPRPGHGIVLLDTDARGVIYLGAWAGEGNTAVIHCFDPSDGHPLGKVTAPMSTTPEESLRDFAVAADGTIVYALRTEEGVSFGTTRCP